MSERRTARPFMVRATLGVCVNALGFKINVLPPRLTVSFSKSSGDYEHRGIMPRVSGYPESIEGANAINRLLASATVSPS